MSILGNTGVFSATAVGTDSGATATQSADASQRYVVTNISGHGDADAVITIESPASTVVWESKIDVSVEGFSFDFSPTIPCAINTAVLGKIAASSADCQVTISGYII
jgi:hypothetical protein